MKLQEAYLEGVSEQVMELTGVPESKKSCVPLNINSRSLLEKELEKAWTMLLNCYLQITISFLSLILQITISFLSKMADSPPPLEPLIPNETTTKTVSNEVTNDQSNVVGAGAWAGQIGEEGTGLWGEHTKATWRRANEWGSEVCLGLHEDFAIWQSDHLDHLLTHSWACIQHECSHCPWNIN